MCYIEAIKAIHTESGGGNNIAFRILNGLEYVSNIS
jgi:hypothetical protein